MARKKRRKRVPVALIVSVLTHGILILTLIFYARSRLAPAKRGVISVDFIESVHHETEPPSLRHKAKPVAKPEASKTLKPQGPAGDPEAVARETDSYIETILQIINQRKVYPRESLEREEEGRVVLGVSVAVDGKVLDVQIEESSPFQRLNASAVKTIFDIKAFPPLPSAVTPPLHLHIPLLYRLESNR